MRLEDHIIKMLTTKAARPLTSPGGAQYLRDDIERVTGERLSINTIKRLLGIIEYDSTPRQTVLDIVARYLGFDMWDQVLAYYIKGVSDFDIPEDFVETSKLRAGAKVSFEWMPDRKITLIKQEDDTFLVDAAVNSKLQKKDIISAKYLCEGFPFMAQKVIRAGSDLGRYVAAKETGIKNLNIKD